MSNILFEGIYAATFSIYDENMNVKRDSVEKLVNYNLKNGLKGFYVGGNTGECTVLPNKTRKQMLEAVKEYASPDAKIMAHVGAAARVNPTAHDSWRSDTLDNGRIDDSSAFRYNINSVYHFVQQRVYCNGIRGGVDRFGSLCAQDHQQSFHE